MINYCLTCNKEFTNLDKHLEKYHNLIPELKNNKGHIKCPLCNAGVDNLWRHYFSKLHRYNVLKNSIEFEYTAENFIKHYDNILRLTKEQVDKDQENPFWQTAKEELNDKDYKKLKEYVYDRRKNISKYTRHSGFGRFNRTYESIKRHG